MDLTERLDAMETALNTIFPLVYIFVELSSDDNIALCRIFLV